MPLRDCPDCKTPISESALVCPICGKLFVQETRGSQILGRISIGAGIVSVVLAVIGFIIFTYLLFSE